MAGKPITVGTDGSEESLRAVEWAAREAALRSSPLWIVSVPGLPPRMSWHQPQGRLMLSQRLCTSLTPLYPEVPRAAGPDVHCGPAPRDQETRQVPVR
jgi:hypothetical protein